MINLKAKIYRPCAPNVHPEVTNVFKPSVVSEILSRPTKIFDSGKEVKCVNTVRDISILMEQRSFENTNLDALLKHFQEQPTDQLKELRSKCSDEQLMQLCKSRYLQRPSEIQSYFDFLESNYDAEVRRLAELQTIETDDTKPSVENDNV